MATFAKEASPQGIGTEYAENYCWTAEHRQATDRTLKASGLFNGTTVHFPIGDLHQDQQQPLPSNTEFHSAQYPSIYRQTTIQKDDRGHYINPYKNLVTKPCGRRLMYDVDHPEKMYPSQWSSELADSNGPYSFPLPTGLDPDIPWTKDMHWRLEGQNAEWPTEQWKQWTEIAKCPPYDGHSDQLEYRKYKVHVP